MNEHYHEYPHKSVTLLAIGLLVFTLFQLTQVLQDTAQLSTAKAQVKSNMEQVDKTLGEGSKMVDQLNTLAIATQKLADAGNANAKEIVSNLNKAGIKIDPNFKKGQAAPANPPGAPPAPNGAVPPAPPAQP